MRILSPKLQSDFRKILHLETFRNIIKYLYTGYSSLITRTVDQSSTCQSICIYCYRNDCYITVNSFTLICFKFIFLKFLYIISKLSNTINFRRSTYECTDVGVTVGIIRGISLTYIISILAEILTESRHRLISNLPPVMRYFILLGIPIVVNILIFV